MVTYARVNKKVLDGKGAMEDAALGWTKADEARQTKNQTLLLGPQGTNRRGGLLLQKISLQIRAQSIRQESVGEPLELSRSTP